MHIYVYIYIHAYIETYVFLYVHTVGMHEFEIILKICVVEVYKL